MCTSLMKTLIPLPPAKLAHVNQIIKLEISWGFGIVAQSTGNQSVTTVASTKPAFALFLLADKTV